jgi:crossover junction endodeoxyribonuclease RusA
MACDALTLELPYPPTANKLYRSVSRGKLAGRTLLSYKARAFYLECGKAIALQRISSHQARFPIKGRLEVTYTVSPPDRLRRDLGNVEKAISDALHKCGVIEDDSQIDALHILRGPVIKGGKLNVSIREL